MESCENIGMYFGYFIEAVVLMCVVIAGFKAMKNQVAPVRTVKATVVDKYRNKSVSKYPDSMRRFGYIVVFETDKKRLSFEVSEFSFNGYKLKERGTLKYKGNKLIEFK